MAIIKVDAFQCDRCNYIWISHVFDKKSPPFACAKCKSVRWNENSRK